MTNDENLFNSWKARRTECSGDGKVITQSSNQRPFVGVVAFGASHKLSLKQNLKASDCSVWSRRMPVTL